ncbi:Membrane bound protein complex subunit mbxB [Thermoanaerobacter thermohydrosulfuricus]|uniref:Multisubunit Na+/H+ antiporter, MnhF subunit n=5 Tax=Thermoanaerobacteraceae TaxID=186814 RepID=I8QYQ4_9THEO|nr:MULTISPECIES: monovalent cation/H+ antiporter complex subunit F [Thermoanaerobacteraceae]EGD52041.1 multiple resistance and pH regulation protein F [Thermoanaerobacter ethanolicus JW 200]HHY79887.1 cation:proton antiporter [Thermoanaerobacter sp.]EIW00248.1 multisubunit Na+/H+ antiporter, MnhF subunit [Thermoanaerobacter siderophilus SR4]EMT39720.1 Multisubunit Na+/H+ antiporter, MnhF subunit [Thermoanaerobacter thermohydrosulfuricus WC1]ERM91250.1 cation:proton antiporter [Caldanaerobacter
MIINVILGLVIFGLLLSFIRLVRSSSIESKVVAIDIMTTISSGLIVIFAFISDNGLFLDVALVYGILSFIGVVAIARYLEGGI